jgi:hypothetical protein
MSERKSSRKKHAFLTYFSEESFKTKKEILSGNEYIIWLIEFIKKHKTVTNSSDDNHNNFSEAERENIKNLDDFFGIIADYCNENLIEGVYNSEVQELVYIVCYKTEYFEIGVSVGQGAYNFVSTSEENINAVNFEDILNDKQSPDLIKKTGILKSLEKHLEYAEESDVPYGAVMGIVERIYSNKKE